MSTPLAIRLAERLIEELDPVSAFLECMTFDDDEARTRGTKLYQMYTMWCTVWGIEPLCHGDFNKDMKRKGYTMVRPGNRIYWCGVAFTSPNYYVCNVAEVEE